MSTIAAGLPPLVPPSAPAVREPKLEETAVILPARADAWSDDKFWEEVNGQRRIKVVSNKAVRVGFRLAYKIEEHADPRGLGQAITEAIFLLDAATSLKRRPDAAFVSRERWPLDRPVPHIDPWLIVPDWAIEVVSPSNLAEELLDKILDYFHAGVRLVWVIYPKQRQVYVYASPTSVQVYADTAELNGGAVLPDFRLSLADLFGPIAPPA